MWLYLPVLNECIKILTTIALGAAVDLSPSFSADLFTPQANKFVFSVALPLLVVRGIGMNIDFYSGAVLWKYVAAFLILRAIALVGSFIWILLEVSIGGQQSRQRQNSTTIGNVAVVWLCFTWISTVILGIPIAASIFGDATKGIYYGLLAAISSFIFQLPLQLLFLECHATERDVLVANTRKDRCDPLGEMAQDECDNEVHTDARERRCESSTVLTQVEEGVNTITSQEIPRSESATRWMTYATQKDVWRRTAVHFVKNPVVWGIIGGFVLSLSTVGPRFLNPKSPEAVRGLAWIDSTLLWFGTCVSPVCLFTMGMWMHNKGLAALFELGWYRSVLYMFCKLVALPAVMLGLAKGLMLDDESGRAAVLISSLPISMASFSLGSHYSVGEAELSQNVTLGTMLMLPTVLLWNLVLDFTGIFPLVT